jgi:small-conductance mechanosensitive channel
MLLEKVLFHNTLKDWVFAIVTVVFLFLAFWILKTIVYRQTKKMAAKTAAQWSDLAIALINQINYIFLFAISAYFAFRLLSLPNSLSNIISKLIGIVILIQIAILATHAIGFAVKRYRQQKIEVNAAAVTTVSSVGFVSKVLLWVILLLVALDNLGINISALVAGLGIGGIAVALAVQNILGDLFASFSIVLDKPFVIGDFIIVDSYLGTIEHIGLKTTRLRSLSGEQLVFSNADLLRSRIRNYKRMYERRVVFSIGVVYQTPHEKLIKIPAIIKDVVETQANTRFDRAHFKEYGPYSLNFEIVYWVENPDYSIYMDIQQNINLEIFQCFQEENIEFAYPSQSLYISRIP